MRVRLIKRADGLWERQLARENQSWANAIRKTHNRRVYHVQDETLVKQLLRKTARRQNWTIVGG